MSLFSKTAFSALLAAGFAMAGNGLLLGGGLNFSKLSISEDLPPEVEESMRTGFNVGAAFEFGLTPMFSVIPGVSLETRGHVFEFSDPESGDLESEINFMYLEVPVLAQVNIPAGPGFFSIFAGPELGILLSAKTKIPEELAEEPGETEEDIKDEIKPIDFSIHFGLGFEFPVGPGAIAFRPGYSVGLTNIDDSESEPDPEFPEEEEPEVKIKHTNFKLAVFYKISL